MVPDNFYGYSAVELEGNNFYYVGCNVVIFLLLHCISIVVIAAGFRYYIVLMTPVPARVIEFVLALASWM